VTASASWRALGTTVSVLVAAAEALEPARALVAEELERVDRACSRFRADSELVRVNRAGGRPVVISEAFAEALRAALRVAEATGGSVVPTLGRSLRALGYDRDFGAGLDERGSASPVRVRGTVRLDGRIVALTGGAELDLGATAKALAADRAAKRVTAATGAGVLVNLGGDIALAGPAPAGGWSVQVGDEPEGPVIALRGGALATSSTAIRAWRRGGERRHHIIDPATGMSCAAVWRTATVAAATCVDANAAATAAIVRGADAPEWLEERALPGRLVAPDGTVIRVAGWPAE
jgi:thiamine biosynthesis lipoprotein